MSSIQGLSQSPRPNTHIYSDQPIYAYVSMVSSVVLVQLICSDADALLDAQYNMMSDV